MPSAFDKRFIRNPFSSMVAVMRAGHPHCKMWGSVWSKPWKTDAWHRMCQSFGLLPSLLGYDLYPVMAGNNQVDKLLAVVFPGVTTVPTEVYESLRKSLRPHIERKRNELYFPDLRLTLNVSALESGERIIISRPHLLFSLDSALKGSLQTTILTFREDAALLDICGGYIGGLCDDLRTPRTLGEVKDVCSVLLRTEDGRFRYHRLQGPGCPRLREIPASYNGESIGPWRFERLLGDEITNISLTGERHRKQLLHRTLRQSIPSSIAE